MKCSFCTYNHIPNTLPLLKKHAYDCMIEGNTNGVTPVVVWRKGIFVLVAQAENDEKVYAIIDPLVEAEKVEEVIDEEELVEE